MAYCNSYCMVDLFGMLDCMMIGNNQVSDTDLFSDKNLYALFSHSFSTCLTRFSNSKTNWTHSTMSLNFLMMMRRNCLNSMMSWMNFHLSCVFFVFFLTETSWSGREIWIGRSFFPFCVYFILGICFCFLFKC